MRPRARVLVASIFTLVACGEDLAPLPSLSSESAFLKGRLGWAQAGFGFAVALSADGRTLAVGAPYQSGVDGLTGAVHLFRKDATGWVLRAHFAAGESSRMHAWWFGFSVALSADGNVLAIGSPGDNVPAAWSFEEGGVVLGFPEEGAGSVYVYEWEPAFESWQRSDRLFAGRPLDHGFFGWDVALSADGETLVVGTPNDGSSATGVGGDFEDEGALSSGAAYMFVSDGVWGWKPSAYLKASNTGIEDHFGISVALSGDGRVVAIGAASEDSSQRGTGADGSLEGAPDSGAVYVFRERGEWRQEAYLKGSISEAEDSFGIVVAISHDGDTLAVSALGDDSRPGAAEPDEAAPDAGGVYVFRRGSGGWAERARFKGDDTRAGDRFGYELALSRDGSVLAVGATGEDSSTTGLDPGRDDLGADCGAAYLFVSRGGWTQHAFVKASNTRDHDAFGAAVALDASGSILAVGAIGEDSGVAEPMHDESAPDSGAVYLF